MVTEGIFHWEVANSPYSSDHLKGDRVFGAEKPIFLIDQFGGRRPSLINSEFIEKGALTFGVMATAIADSNLMDGICGLMDGGDVDDGLTDFVRFVSENGWNVSAEFYLLEQYAKSSEGEYLIHATRRMTAFHRFLAMDVPHYLRTGQARIDEGLVTIYGQRGLGSTMEEIARSHVQSRMANLSRRVLVEMIEVSEIAILKMVLIKEFELGRASVEAQYMAFATFLDDVLKIRLAREEHLALRYFAGLVGRLLGVKPNTSRRRALATISSTAWDLMLLRMPEMILCPPEQDGIVDLGYVATREKRLAELASLMKVHTLYSGLLPAVELDISDIPAEIVRGIQHKMDRGFNGFVPRKQQIEIPVGLRESLVRTLEARLPG